MNYGMKKGKKYDPRSMAQDTTGAGVMQAVPRDRAAPLARPMKRKPKMNVQTGKYVSN
jgi:uncharacterized membrane protein